MTELILCGFDDVQTAFLARATLARLQSDLPLSTRDVAVVMRSESGEVTVQEAVTRTANAGNSASFWQILADYVFDSVSPTPNAGNDLYTELAAVGIDLRLLHGQADRIRRSGSSIFVLTHDTSTRERVLGVVSGFRSQTLRVTLSGPPTHVMDASEADSPGS